MITEGILETALYADNIDAAEAFYRDVLGLAFFGKVPGRHVFFRCGAQMLLIFNADASQKPSSSTTLPVPAHGMTGTGHVCFRASAEDMDRWRRHLEAAGIAIEADFTWPEGGRSIYFRDPAGNSVEFAEARIWGL